MKAFFGRKGKKKAPEGSTITNGRGLGSVQPSAGSSTGCSAPPLSTSERVPSTNAASTLDTKGAAIGTAFGRHAGADHGQTLSPRSGIANAKTGSDGGTTGTKEAYAMVQLPVMGLTEHGFRTRASTTGQFDQVRSSLAVGASQGGDGRRVVTGTGDASAKASGSSALPNIATGHAPQASATVNHSTPFVRRDAHLRAAAPSASGERGASSTGTAPHTAGGPAQETGAPKRPGDGDANFNVSLSDGSHVGDTAADSGLHGNTNSPSNSAQYHPLSAPGTNSSYTSVGSHKGNFIVINSGEGLDNLLRRSEIGRLRAEAARGSSESSGGRYHTATSPSSNGNQTTRAGITASPPLSSPTRGLPRFQQPLLDPPVSSSAQQGVASAPHTAAPYPAGGVSPAPQLPTYSGASPLHSYTEMGGAHGTARLPVFSTTEDSAHKGGGGQVSTKAPSPAMQPPSSSSSPHKTAATGGRANNVFGVGGEMVVQRDGTIDWYSEHPIVGNGPLRHPVHRPQPPPPQGASTGLTAGPPRTKKPREQFRRRDVDLWFPKQGEVGGRSGHGEKENHPHTDSRDETGKTSSFGLGAPGARAPQPQMATSAMFTSSGPTGIGGTPGLLPYYSPSFGGGSGSSARGGGGHLGSGPPPKTDKILDTTTSPRDAAAAGVKSESDTTFLFPRSSHLRSAGNAGDGRYPSGVVSSSTATTTGVAARLAWARIGGMDAGTENSSSGGGGRRRTSTVKFIPGAEVDADASLQNPDMFVNSDEGIQCDEEDLNPVASTGVAGRRHEAPAGAPRPGASGGGILSVTGNSPTKDAVKEGVDNNPTGAAAPGAIAPSASQPSTGTGAAPGGTATPSSATGTKPSSPASATMTGTGAATPPAKRLSPDVNEASRCTSTVLSTAVGPAAPAGDAGTDRRRIYAPSDTDDQSTSVRVKELNVNFTEARRWAGALHIAPPLSATVVEGNANASPTVGARNTTTPTSRLSENTTSDKSVGSHTRAPYISTSGGGSSGGNVHAGDSGSQQGKGSSGSLGKLGDWRGTFDNILGSKGRKKGEKKKKQ